MSPVAKRRHPTHHTPAEQDRQYAREIFSQMKPLNEHLSALVVVHVSPLPVESPNRHQRPENPQRNRWEDAAAGAISQESGRIRRRLRTGVAGERENQLSFCLRWTAAASEAAQERGMHGRIHFSGFRSPEFSHCGSSWHLSKISGGMCQMKIAPSWPTETMKLWSGEIATALISPLCPTPMYLQRPSS